MFFYFVGAGFGDVFAAFQVFQQFGAVFRRAEDGFHLAGDFAAGAATREGEVAHGDAAFVERANVFVQQLAVVAGGVEEDGDGVFFVFRREEDHFVLERFEFGQERAVTEVDRAVVAEFDQVALQVVFAVFGRVEDALLGDDAAQAGHGAVADFYGFQAEGVQFLGDGGVVGVRGGSECQQGQGNGFFHVFLCHGGKAADYSASFPMRGSRFVVAAAHAGRFGV